MQKGFTIIEVLVVIAIMALLSSILMVAITNQRTAARNVRYAADFKQIETQVNLSRLVNNKTVLQITGNGCSDCGFRDGTSVQSHTALLSTINTTWQRLGFAASPVDPWGNPYLLDENEQEGGTTDCRYDNIFSAGKNGVDEAGGGDDVSYNLSHFVCPN